jgi:hypothetical protein
MRFWIKLWIMAIGIERAAPLWLGAAERRALDKLRSEARAHGADLHGVSDEELAAGVRQVAKTYRAEGLEAHLLAAGYARIGREWILLL